MDCYFWNYILRYNINIFSSQDARKIPVDDTMIQSLSSSFSFTVSFALLAHLTQRFMWAIVTTERPSVNFSHFNQLLWNHWANLNQTLVEWSLYGPLPKLCPVITTSNQDGHQAKNITIFYNVTYAIFDYLEHNVNIFKEIPLSFHISIRIIEHRSIKLISGLNYQL